jgi:hypothetical protein
MKKNAVRQRRESFDENVEGEIEKVATLVRFVTRLTLMSAIFFIQIGL